MTRQHLIIDADDTLWENNIYFERAFDAFVEYLDHSSLTPKQVRDVLDDIEAANARVHGYGSANFGRNLQQCFQNLAERDVCEDDLRTVLHTLGGGCSVPVGAVATEDEHGGLCLTAAVFELDASRAIRVELRGTDAVELGQAAARRLLELGAGRILGTVPVTIVTGTVHTAQEPA